MNDIDFLDFKKNPALQRALAISLFTDARANNARGWWGDSFLESPIGSKLWAVAPKITPQNMGKAKYEAQTACRWLVDDGVLDAVEVSFKEIEGQIFLSLVLQKGDKLREVDYYDSSANA